MLKILRIFIVARSTRAWIETRPIAPDAPEGQSHALRVRGLKLWFIVLENCPFSSHALRVRGLKLWFCRGFRRSAGRTLYACVD